MTAHRTSFSWMAALAVLSLAAPVAAQAPLLDGLGGPAGYGPEDLPGNDDGSSDVIPITAAFPAGLEFFGATYNELYVNNNGNISFGRRLGTYTPSAFPIASQPIIAPWWGDVDTRGGGTPTRNGVYWSISPGRFVATWHNVGYYARHDDLSNDFQLILTAAPPGPGDFDVEFRYNRCEWTTGDASGGSGGFGGTPAQAGFDAGNLVDYIALPGSLSMQVLNLCTTSNVGIPGVWRFEIRSGVVMCPGQGDACMTGMLGVCAEGTRVCVSPDASECRAVNMPSDDECNGRDDDCDGLTDESLGTSTCGVGACVNTVENCVAGREVMCTPLAPTPERCNLIDDDCDGVTDNMPDLECGVGRCMRTATACVDGVSGVCVPGSPTVELCNGFDDDCDGVTDEIMGCVSPDAGPPDAGDLPDGSVPDGGPGECVGRNCDPFRLGGRAGPIGKCSCRAAGGGGESPLALGFGLALLGLVIARRRRG